MRRSIPILLALLLALAPAVARAEAFSHAVETVFAPESGRMSVADTVALPPGIPARLNFTLSPRVSGLAAAVDGAPAPFTRSGDSVSLSLPPEARMLTLKYTLPLDAPPASLPASMDNPGAMASDAACGTGWAMLMPGSLWHPQVAGGENAYALRVSAPAGIKAVTQGAASGFTEEPGRTISAWNVPHPVGRLGLCLARYEFSESRDGPVPVQTFLLEGSRHLAPAYLAASAKHLRFYQDLHGPYAYEKFAVVENPLPTGYGFPSYTLLGSQVIALPFIPETSLRHEIAHSWWGNGVLVDFDHGNWCEGLTTYMADYLAQAEQSPQAARAYRLKTLRAFADLVRQGGDTPLERFGSRFSPASQAVGYGKALFVFHMLRGFVGDEAFFLGLRRLYADFLFKPASWEDIRKTFAGLEGFDEPTSRAFFTQWLTRTGGPRLKIARADISPALPGPDASGPGPAKPGSPASSPSGGCTLRARIVQEGQPYLLKLDAVAETPAGPVRTSLLMDGPAKELTLDLPAKPTRLALDPGADCFRVLDPSEVPPSVNSVKGAPTLTVILADQASPAVRQALPRLLAGLGQERVKVVEEGSLTPAKLAQLAQGGLLVAGTPRKEIPGYREALPQAPEADTVFAVLPRPGGFTAVFQAKPEASTQDVATAAAKVTHYGSYGLLGFDKGRNVARQTPEAPGSPMVWEFQE